MTFVGRGSTISGLVLIFAAAAATAQAQPQDAPAVAAPEPGAPIDQRAPAAATTTPAPVAPAEPPPEPAAGPVTPADDVAKMAELLSEDSGLGPTAEPSIKLYGFADFNSLQFLGLPKSYEGILPDHQSFYVGHLNLFVEGNMAPGWKSMIEVRYLFLPDGSASGSSINDPLANSGRYDATTRDYADDGHPITWSGIDIERAYLEHNFTDFLSVRVGRFLTPWGIWNVDHGSPVIIGPTQPYVIGESFFPDAQTGFDAFGSIPLGDHTFGYHLTLSNGRGPTEAHQDLDNNKAIGGRVYLKLHVLGEMAVGFSGYGGTVTDERQEVNLATQSLAVFQFEHYREVSWAGDFQWTWKALHFQTEAALQDRVWSNNARPVTGAGVQEDLRRFGLYALLAYRLPWLNLMPYVLYQYYDTGSRTTFLPGAARVQGWSGGLNVRIMPSVVFKVEYSLAIFGDTVPTSVFRDSFKILNAQIAWAF